MCIRDRLKDVIKYKKCFFRNGFSNYEACLTKHFKLIPNQAVLDQLKKDYQGMESMIYGDVPEFSMIIDTLTVLEKDINERF